MGMWLWNSFLKATPSRPCALPARWPSNTAASSPISPRDPFLPEGPMQRRELFRLLGAGAALPVFDSNLLAMFQAAQPKSGYTLRTLNPHQNATLVIITDLIIPETDTP